MSANLILEATRLPVAQKLALIEAVWDSLIESGAELPMPAWHAAVLDERLADLERDPDAGQSWDEVRAALERRS